MACASPLIKREMQFLGAAGPRAPHGPAPAARAGRAGRAEGRRTRRGRARSQSAGQDSPASPSEVPGRAAAKPARKHRLARGPDGHVQVTGLPPGGVGGPPQARLAEGLQSHPALWSLGPALAPAVTHPLFPKEPWGGLQASRWPRGPTGPPLCLAKRSPLLTARLILNAQGLGGLEGFPAQACRGGQPGPACCVSLGEDASVPGQAGAAPPGTDAPSPRVPCEPQA